MGIIFELDNNLINKIAAGEVIESPHSVVKELIENSLDARSEQVDIHTQSGGIESILIADNGNGIAEDDIELAVKRHATSKIRDLQDLESILSYGFRGEALASVAAVSELFITSGIDEINPALKASFINGILTNKEVVTGFKGTKILVKDLFYNTPVRRKFIKSERSEDRKIREKISSIAICRNDVAFRYRQDEKEIFNLKPETKEERIISVMGEGMRGHLISVDLEWKGIHARGFISDPDFYRSNRTGQYIYINNRPVEVKYSSSFLKKAYDELLPPTAHPYCFLFFEIDPSHIDVNVHPAKKEIRFLNEELFQAFFLQLINNSLRSSTPVSFLEMKHRLSKPIQVKPKQEEKKEESLLQNILHNDLYQKPHVQKAYSVNTAGAGIKLGDLTEAPRVHREFIPKKHFGLVFETFILAEAEDGLYIIDQHTAHERIRYEEVLKKLKKSSNLSQTLLSPMRIDLSMEEYEEIIEYGEEFQKVGLTFEPFGNGTIVLREVPVYLEAGREKETILDFFERLKSSEEKELFDIMAKSVACKSAIKKGDHVSDHILAELLNRLSYCENPSRCPHGRPTLIKLSKNDLEKMFHRK